MTNYCKHYFKTSKNNKHNVVLNKFGVKGYYNILHDILTNKLYKFYKYVEGYNCYVTVGDFNIIRVKLTILTKTNKDYVNVVRYINLFNTNFVYLK